jgi:hypothetical protein
MDLYATTQPYSNPPDEVRCDQCGRASKGFFYCFDCRRDHAERVRLYMAKRRKDPEFVAAERVATRLRMRRLRARRRQEANGLALVEGGDVR